MSKPAAKETHMTATTLPKIVATANADRDGADLVDETGRIIGGVLHHGDCWALAIGDEQSVPDSTDDLAAALKAAGWILSDAALKQIRAIGRDAERREQSRVIENSGPRATPAAVVHTRESKNACWECGELHVRGELSCAECGAQFA